MNQMSKPKKDVEMLTKEKKGKNRQKEQLDQTSNETETERKEKRPSPPVPTTTAQFYCHCKELTERQKYPFLKSIPLKQLTKVSGAAFDSEILNDVMRTLHDYYLPQKDPLTALTLLEISKNKQTSILSLLMSNDERKDNLAVKPNYRRMSAHESLGDNMDALKGCTSVLTIDPKNGEAKRSVERINERLRKTGN
uniref:RNA polymerase II-associated protein 3 n=1 Tax=Glossina pallidipes TaxID=7398 RepID=A0A1A9ZQV7_GLOPL